MRYSFDDMGYPLPVPATLMCEDCETVLPYSDELWSGVKHCPHCDSDGMILPDSAEVA